MRTWGDGKRFLFDHIFDSVLYGTMFIGSAFLDPILNYLHSVGFNVAPGEPLGHPYEIGKYQVALLVLSFMQVLRLVQKLREWKYYS